MVDLGLVHDCRIAKQPKGYRKQDRDGRRQGGVWMHGADCFGHTISS